MKDKLLALQKATEQRDAALALFEEAVTGNETWQTAMAEYEMWLAATREEHNIEGLKQAVDEARQEVDSEALTIFGKTKQKTVYAKDKEGYGVGIAESEKLVIYDEKEALADIVALNMVKTLCRITLSPFKKWAKAHKDIGHDIKGVGWETSRTVRVTLPKKKEAPDET